VLGYVYTFMRLKGGRPPPHECTLVARFLRMAALVVLSYGPHSVRVRLTLLIVMVTLPTAGPLITPFQQLLRRWTARGAEPAPSWYRPPTSSGQYLTQEQYDAQARIATDNGLQSLFKSPEYQAWLLANHHRLALSGDQMRQPNFDSEEDE